MQKLNLYDISTEIEALSILMVDELGEITEASEELESYIENLLSSKTDGCAEYIRKLDDKVLNAKSRIDDLKKIAITTEKIKSNFINYIHLCMTKADKTEISGDLHTIRKRKPAKVLVIEDDKNIPLDFVETITIPETTEIKINKVELKKHLKDNKIEGVYLKDSDKKSIIIK